MTEYEKIDRELTLLEDEMLQSVRECVRIESVKSDPLPDAPFGPGPKAALDYAMSLGEKLGFRTKNVNNRSCYMEFGEGEEMVGVLAHLDVVPATGDWIYSPFQAELHDGILYGRGVMDNKGPAVGSVYALRAIANSGLPLKRRIRVILGTDEECGSACMKNYIASKEELPSIGFTPDGMFPLTYSEKGMIQFRLTRKLTEPESNKVLSLVGGQAANVVTPSCQIKLQGDICVKPDERISSVFESGTTTVSAIGKSAHGSQPSRGINAAILLMNALGGKNLGTDFEEFSRFIMEMLGNETDGSALNISAHDEETGDTTVNLGMVRFDKEQFSMTLDIRFPRGQSAAVIEERIRNKAALYGMDVEKILSENNLYVPKDSELIQKLMQVYRAKTGRKEEPMAMGGGTYAKSFQNMVAFGPGFPEDEFNAHSPNEQVHVDRLKESIHIIAAAMYELAK